MLIQNIEIGEIKIPLKKPFHTALRSVNCVNDILVRVTLDNGMEGYGEASPTAVITGDTKGSIAEAILQFIRPKLIGKEIEDMDGNQKILHSCLLHNMSAKAAVDMALYDLFAKRINLPLYQLLGGNKNILETDLTISVNPIGQMLKDSMEAVEKGYRILKIKMGKDGLTDIMRIAAIRKAVGESVKLRVDANQGWTSKQAVQIISKMEDMGLQIELVEQPVPANDLTGLKMVTNQVYTNILADESVFNFHDAIHVIQEKAADYINIKLMKTGGIYKALHVCGAAEEFGISCMMGCMLESKIAVGAAAHFAAGKAVVTMVDLDGPSLCESDPYIGGPEFEGQKIVMPSEAGLGIRKIPCKFFDSF